MHPQRKKRLLGILVIILGVSAAVAVTLMALKRNINLFYMPSDLVKTQPSPDRTIRVGGLVLKGSVIRDPEKLGVSFTLGDTTDAKIVVHYQGILPDLFREGQGIIATGKLQADGRFEASEVLAKHDENYMPPEVADGLKRAPGHPKKTETK